MADVRAVVELFGARSCPYTRELREELQWQGAAFVEYDVEGDAAARARLLAMTGGRPAVPVLLRDGSIAQVGWQGRSCLLDPDPRP